MEFDPQMSQNRRMHSPYRVAASVLVLIVVPVLAQTPAAPVPGRQAIIDELVVANHILYDHGVVDAFGHVSVRHDKQPDRFLLARNMAPGSVTAAMLAPGAVSSLDSPNGSTTGVLRVGNNGLVGVGSTNAQAGLEVDGGKTILAPALLTVLVDDVGSFSNLAGACSLAVNGNLLAISGQDDNAFTLVDMSVPTNIVMLSSIQNGTGSFTNLATLTDVAWSSNLLAVGSFESNAVTLVDTTTPGTPVCFSPPRSPRRFRPMRTCSIRLERSFRARPSGSDSRNPCGS